MRTFRDTQNREWKLDLNVFLLKKVREETGKVLTGIADNNCELLIQLHEDCELLVNVLWCLCESQAKALGVVDDEQSQATEKFAMSLGGDSLGDAAEALVGAVTDFFSSQEQRKALTALMEKAKKAQTILGEALLKKIEAINPNSLAETITDSALNSPQSPESTPGTIPLAS